ncbi:DUF6387 family protein [Ferrimonas sp.]|uniref:DUF6387 family protein n=1 Tax=Ferrimonas sp. TaxID=2080861 RepID=UPI003A8FD65B
MSKRLVRTPEEILSWFRLGNYDDIKDLSGLDVVNVLYERAQIFLWCSEGLVPRDVALERIKSSKPIEPRGVRWAVGEARGITSADEHENRLGVMYDVVEPLTFGLLAGYTEHAIQREDIPKLSEKPIFDKICDGELSNSIHDHVSASEDVKAYPHNVLAEIQLTDNTDEQIIGAIATLLPHWRKKMNAPEPDKPMARVGESTIRKILDYKLIPWLDLETWALIEGVKINRSVMARILFGDDWTKDSNWISKDKGGKWFLRAIDPNFVIQLRGFLATQPELAARPIGRYRSKED